MFKKKRSVIPVTVQRVNESGVTKAWSDGFGKLATRAIQGIAIILLAIGLIFGLQAVSVVVIPVLLALILASAFEPVMRFLRNRRVPSVLATVIVLVGVAGLLTLISWLITNAVRNQWDELAARASEGAERVIEWVNGLNIPQLEVVVGGLVDDLPAWAADFVTSSQFGTGAITGISAVAAFATGFVLLIVVLFFFLKDGPLIWNFLLRPFEGEWYDRAQRAGTKTVQTLGSYIRGTASVAAVDAIGIYIGLAILGIPLAVPLAVLVFILAFIPIVGATLAGILAALVALVSHGLVHALIVTGIVVLVNQLEGNFLQPVLMGRALKLNSLVILVVLAIGTVLGGVLGAILAVPLTAVAWAIVQVWDGPNTPARWARKKHEPQVAPQS